MTGMQNIQNYNQLEKSRGILLFAFNSKFNYVNIAIHTAKFVRKNLNLPVTLVTDQPVATDAFDHIIIVDNKFYNFRHDGSEWRNGNRYQAFDLSPYDETLLIDSDYIILDNKLLKLFDTVKDYNIFSSTKFLDIEPCDTMGFLKLPFLWATAILFKKTLRTKLLFQLVKNIQNNYKYYYQLYQITDSNFRNDYAFTIADNILNGYGPNNNCYIPWPLISVNKLENLQKFDNKLIIKTTDKAIISPIQNLHILDKQFLLSENFKQFMTDYGL